MSNSPNEPIPAQATPAEPVPAEPIDVKTFWRAIGVRAIGAAVVAAQAGDGPRGLFALSATHLSADPPLMAVAVDRKTSALATILEARHFSINYLGTGQSDLADVFGGKSDLQGADRFGTATWNTMQTGAPALEGAVGVLDCELDDVLEKGDTMIVIGRLVAYRAEAGAAPLVLFQGKPLSLA